MESLRRTRQEMRRFMLSLLRFKVRLDVAMLRYQELHDKIEEQITHLYVRRSCGTAQRRDEEGRYNPSCVDAYRNDAPMKLYDGGTYKGMSEHMVGRSLFYDPTRYTKGSLIRGESWLDPPNDRYWSPR